MSKYLVHVQKEVDPPAYIKHNPYVNLSSLISIEEGRDYENVNVLEGWPTTSSHSLDNSQSRALKRILTSELAIIQGPPGTGKTLVSVVALQIACNNLRKEDAPIIVTAQTNHALDQLLRHTSQFEPNYIRLGGRSKDKDRANRKEGSVAESIGALTGAGGTVRSRTPSARSWTTRRYSISGAQRIASGATWRAGRSRSLSPRLPPRLLTFERPIYRWHNGPRT